MKKYTGKTIRYFWHQILHYKLLSCVALFGLLIATIGDLFIPVILKDFVNLLAGSPDAETVHSVMRIFVYFILINVLNWVGWRIGTFTFTIMEAGAMKDIGEDCFNHLHKHSFQFFNNQFVGALVKRVNRMVRSFEEITDKIFFEFLPLFVRTVVTVTVLWIIDARIGALVLAWFVLYIVVNIVISRYKMKKYDLPRAEADTAVTAMLADTVSNHSTIRLFAGLNFEKKRFAKTLQNWRERLLSAWFFEIGLDAIFGVLIAGIDIAVIYIGIQLWKTGDFTPGHFVLLQSYMLELYHQLWSFGRTLRRFYELFADANEMMEIIEKPSDIVDAPGARILRVPNGEVRFDDVNFSYTGQEEHDVIKNLSFKVKSGERVALIGPSGGGKTTIVKLLLRLFDVPRGKIFVDDFDISKIKQDSLHANIALVPQDPVLFHRSLMENIRYGRPDATRKEVIWASKLAHCHEFISHFPDGYETFVGERGVKLSGGERQRVAIARAILANTKILILDEATSSLDSESEKLIKDALNNLMKNKTVFVIAHRLSTVIDMDRILVLEKGRIVEEGNHGELIKKDGGLYRKLWELQVGGYLVD
ncbi:MAG: ABC transporter ATP-binding protein [Candidatus Gracilibacteria bacterium]